MRMCWCPALLVSLRQDIFPCQSAATLALFQLPTPSPPLWKQRSTGVQTSSASPYPLRRIVSALARPHLPGPRNLSWLGVLRPLHSGAPLAVLDSAYQRGGQWYTRVWIHFLLHHRHHHAASRSALRVNQRIDAEYRQFAPALLASSDRDIPKRSEAHPCLSDPPHSQLVSSLLPTEISCLSWRKR